MSLSVLGLPGCFDGTPEYSVPSRVPPVMDSAGALPSASDVYRTQASEVDFNVRFRSDDAGERLHVFFVLDLPANRVEPPRVQNDYFVEPDPAPFDEQTQRSLSYQWTWGSVVSSRCHTMTLILSHESNFSSSYKVDDELGAAQLTWFLDLSLPGDTGQACWPSGIPGALP
jgi:hypothetical protein